MLETHPGAIAAVIPRTAEPGRLAAASRPLYELAGISSTYRYELGAWPTELAQWPMANDITANAYAEASLRIGSAEYLAAPNRVAIIFGEGFLHTSIIYMPEDTIIMADISGGENDFMGQYGAALQHFGNSESWLAYMGMVASLKSKNENPVQYQENVRLRAYQWEESGHPSAILDEATYREAHEAAKSKALIPWRMDLANPDDFIKLAKHLENLNATVTFMNTTNIMGILKIEEIEETVAANIALLPHTPSMPIIGTSWLIRRALRVHPGNGPEDMLTNRVIFGPNHLRQIGEIGLLRTQEPLAERVGIRLPA